MAKKRKNTDWSLDQTLHSKRSRPSINGGDSPSEPTSVHPRIDPTYGQRGAFPGLDENTAEDDGLFYGPASDGLEYLRMVRSEAKMVPNLLVASISPTSPSTELYADYPKGRYCDGAYIAAPKSPNSPRPNYDNEPEDINPQEAYYTSLLARFTNLTRTLQSPPLHPFVVTSAGSLYSATHATWRYHILHTQPTMTTLSQLPQETVIRGLSVLETQLTRGNMGKGKAQIGVWAWGLLGKCREVGEMGSEEVGVLRGLGKRAVWVVRGMVTGREEKARQEEEEGIEGEEVGDGDEAEIGREDEKMAQEGEEIDDESIAYAENSSDPSTTIDAPPIGIAQRPDTAPQPDPGEKSSSNATSSDPLALAQKRLLSSLPGLNPLHPPTQTATPQQHQNSALSPNTPPQSEERNLNAVSTAHATLDMIITIIGERYGQRDLLGGRVLWDELT